VGEAIDAALGHAKTIGMNEDVLLQIRALKDINLADRKTIQERVDAIIDRSADWPFRISRTLSHRSGAHRIPHALPKGFTTVTVRLTG